MQMKPQISQIAQIKKEGFGSPVARASRPCVFPVFNLRNLRNLRFLRFFIPPDVSNA